MTKFGKVSRMPVMLIDGVGVKRHVKEDVEDLRLKLYYAVMGGP